MGTHKQTFCVRETERGERVFPSEHWESHVRGGRKIVGAKEDEGHQENRVH